MIKLFMVIASLIAILPFVPSNHAEACSVEVIRSMIEEGLTDDQIETICDRAKLYQGSDDQKADVYTKAQRLYNNQQFDDMVALLGTYCQDNHYDFKANLLLAQAYMEQVERLKAKDDKEYKDLVMKTYYIGRRFVSSDPENAAALYIAARSFLLNDRANRCLKYIKKAVSVTTKDVCEYYIALGDAIVETAANAATDHEATFSQKEAQMAYQKAVELAQIDWVKEKAEKRLAAVK